MAKRVVLPALFLVTFISGGCLPPPGPSKQAGNPKLIPFDSEAALLSYFQQQAIEQTRPQRRGGWLFGRIPTLAPGAAEDNAVNAAPTDGTGGSTAYSTTNLQEAGVDESDVFKSDGTYFYIAREQSLRIVQASPPEALAEIANVDLGAWIDALYLRDKTIIALGSQADGARVGAAAPDGAEIMIWPPYYPRAKISVIQIDISDPANPAITHRLELDGCLVSSRLTGGRLIVVLTVVPELPAQPTPREINRMTLTEVMPKARASGGASADAVPWSNWLRPEAPDGCAMTAVLTLDAGNVETIVESAAVLANAGTIYASPEALYLTDSAYDPDDNYRENTVIHKFSFGEDGAARYTASGSVPGRLLNQFALSDHKGNLRVATHRVGNGGVFWDDVVVGVAVAESGNTSSSDDAPPPGTAQDRADTQNAPQEPDNAVFVLGESNGALDILGSVANFGTNEQIYAVRFLGDHGFVVTFRQIDPLFVLDLSDPQDPRLVGELEMPGYSEYLHPLGENHLMGVGRTTDESEWGRTSVKGIQLSLFDVSDWTNPQVVQQLSLGSWGSYSEISATHKAFTFIERDGQTLIALPAVLTSEGGTYYYSYEFAGVLCYSVDPTAGFTKLGEVAAVGRPIGWWPQWQRAAFIGNELYALTPDGIRAAPLTDFNATEQITLSE